MATGNFYPHKNGIFVLPSMTYDEAKRALEEDNDVSDPTDEEIAAFIFLNEESNYEDFEESLACALDRYGMYYYTLSDDHYQVYRNDRIVGEILLRSGYYAGMQVLVETDPDELGIYYDTKTELFEEYTPNNKTLFKAIDRVTKELAIVARFSSGETWYDYKVG